MIDASIGGAGAPRFPGNDQPPLDRDAEHRLDHAGAVDGAVGEGDDHVGETERDERHLVDADAAAPEHVGDDGLRAAAGGGHGDAASP